MPGDNAQEDPLHGLSEDEKADALANHDAFVSTAVTFRLDTVHRGDLSPGQEITVMQTGGVLNGVAYVAHGGPNLEPGDGNLLFAVLAGGGVDPLQCRCDGLAVRLHASHIGVRFAAASHWVGTYVPSLSTTGSIRSLYHNDASGPSTQRGLDKMKQARFVPLVRSMAVVAAAALLAASASTATASDGSLALDEADIVQLTEFFEGYGVPPATQSVLLIKLAAGEIWDSLSPDATPVSVEQYETDTSAVRIDTYDDGSIGVTSADRPQPEPPAGTIPPLATLTGCTASPSGTTRIRTNCKVGHSTGIITMHFRANYRWTYYDDHYDFNVKSARIDSVDALVVQAIGGSYSGRKLSIIRKNAGTQPALARGEVDIAAGGGWGGATAMLELFVPRGDSTLAYVRRTY